MTLTLTRRTRSLFAVLLALLALLPASAALADKPTREPLPAEDFTLTGVCPFPVRVEVMANKEKATTFTTKGGERTIVTGTLRVRLTNLATGESRELNVSGPVFVTPHEDGSATVVLRGRSLIFSTPGSTIAPTLQLTSGPVVLEVDAKGAITQLDQRGQAEDLCKALAE